MKDIYSRAKHVVVWLGPDEDGQAALAIPIVNSAAAAAENLDVSRKPILDLFLVRDSEDHIKVGERLLPRGHADMQAVWWLFRREWFSRVWVIQEVSQDRESIVMIGDHSVSYRILVMAACAFALKRYPLVFQNWETLNWVISVDNKIIKKHLSGHPPYLLDIVSQFSGLKATNPRDKLYALIGLSKEGRELEKYPLINPDYRKTVVQTYIDLVWQLISAPRGRDYGEGGLDVLGLTDIRRYREIRSSPATHEQEGFPSWVPRFDRGVAHLSSISTEEKASNWATSYHSAVQLGLVSSSASLVLRGVRLGTVAKVYTNPEYYAGRLLGFAGLFEQVNIDFTNYQGPGCVAEAFAQAIQMGGASDVTSEQDLRRKLEMHRKYVLKNHPDPRPEHIRTSWPYRIFLTNNGYLGVGAPPLLGSEIWLLFGGRTLYILHHKEDYYTYVGECFIHGFMNGEGMELWKAGKLESEWVDLR